MFRLNTVTSEMPVRVNMNASGDEKCGRGTAAVKIETHTLGILMQTHTHTLNDISDA